MKHFEADMFHVRNGVYDWQASKARQGHEWCLNQTRESLNKGKSVIVANTFTTYQELAPYLELAEELDVEVEVIKCMGEFDSEHNVPESTLRKMADRWEDIDDEEVYDPHLKKK
jgi:predicted kinase